eukprot:NODE_2965_length_849_cov_439.555416.p8 GENE.NODE_2965_length_849_cov_439.555416~~NODE_2965_length_849_cov_439.555416.p8  ORF type:complete len:62 (-),score=32.97 NODE_2965_length_849_cov_439.555416:49-234(-)
MHSTVSPCDHVRFPLDCSELEARMLNVTRQSSWSILHSAETSFVDYGKKKKKKKKKNTKRK